MQALKQRQQEQAKLRDILNAESTEKTIEERVERCRELQYEKHQQLFAVSYTDLHKAAADNSLSGVKYFLQTGVKRGMKSKAAKLQVLEQLNKNGLTPLHCAADKGALDVINFLLENDCNINIQSREGNTALMYACKANQLEVIRLFIEKKANILVTNQCGMNCIHFAAQSDNHAAIQTLVDTIHDRSSLATARTETSLESALLLEEELQSETNENSPLEKQLYHALSQPSNNLTTPLHLACSYGAEQTVRTLIRCGANINAQDTSGDTALHKAARNNFFQIYRFLLCCGASDELRNNFRETAADCLVDSSIY